MDHLLLLEIVSNAILGIYASFTMFRELWGGSLLFIYPSLGKAKAEIREIVRRAMFVFIVCTLSIGKTLFCIQMINIQHLVYQLWNYTVRRIGFICIHIDSWVVIHHLYGKQHMAGYESSVFLYCYAMWTRSSLALHIVYFFPQIAKHQLDMDNGMETNWN